MRPTDVSYVTVMTPSARTGYPAFDRDGVQGQEDGGIGRVSDLRGIQIEILPSGVASISRQSANCARHSLVASPVCLLASSAQ